mmetsp:Transcript_30199/g.61527  ORF Transcript_30199/g.61527 Transcript_30199/m.61527 type:complete len:261 (+) Transcript_30199:242-1024(+)
MLPAIKAYLGIFVSVALLATSCDAVLLSRRATLASIATGALLPSVAGAVPAAELDLEYPGTAVARMRAARSRISELSPSALDADWGTVRRTLLWAGGLRDLPHAKPGEGYTGHSFNDFNHCDLTCMLGGVQEESNGDGAVRGISTANALGAGIRAASLPELGEGGSWSTCMIGSAKAPPQDVAHVQFKSRVAFKLVWSPASPAFRSFVLVDDAGQLLARGAPSSGLEDSPGYGGPSLEQRKMNYDLVRGSKYAVAAGRPR